MSVLHVVNFHMLYCLPSASCHFVLVAAAVVIDVYDSCRRFYGFILWVSSLLSLSSQQNGFILVHNRSGSYNVAEEEIKVIIKRKVDDVY